MAGVAEFAAAIVSQREKPARRTVRQKQERSLNRESTSDNSFCRPSQSYVHAAIEDVEIRGT